MISRILSIFCKPVKRDSPPSYSDIFLDPGVLQEVVVDVIKPQVNVCPYYHQTKSLTSVAECDEELDCLYSLIKSSSEERIPGKDSPRCIIDNSNQLPVNEARKAFIREIKIETSLPRYQMKISRKKRPPPRSRIPRAIEKKENESCDESKKQIKDKENERVKSELDSGIEIDANKQLATIMKQKSRKYGGGWTCHRCKNTVYHAERLIACGNAFHKTCFSCYSCKKPLATTYLEAEMEIFCQLCYIRNFGLNGNGFGMRPVSY